jgi:DNA-binding GntR family transcriptional regulator
LLSDTRHRHPTLVDRVVDEVYDRIARGELRAGQRITEDHLAAEFGVSRTPVREAVKRLAELGVMVIYPRARLEVASADAEMLQQITRLREDLECLALQYAMPFVGDHDIKHLEKLANQCHRLAQSGDRIGTFRADSEFHFAIANLSGNAYLVEALHRLNAKVQLCRATRCLSKKKILSNVRFHQQIIDAMRDRNGEQAITLMRQHIQTSWAGRRFGK